MSDTFRTHEASQLQIQMHWPFLAAVWTGCRWVPVIGHLWLAFGQFLVVCVRLGLPVRRFSFMLTNSNRATVSESAVPESDRRKFF